MVETSDTVSGAVLTGGRSRRLGRDKAGLDPYGLGSMLDVGLVALRASGCADLAMIGGAARPTAIDGVVHVADMFPDEGPLGGIISALRWSPSDLVVVVACDMPFLHSAVIDSLITTLRSAPACAVALASVGEREQPLTAVWRRSFALRTLEGAFTAGERAPRRVLPQLEHRLVPIVDPAVVVDIDSEADIDRYAHIARLRREEE